MARYSRGYVVVTIGATYGVFTTRVEAEKLAREIGGSVVTL